MELFVKGNLSKVSNKASCLMFRYSMGEVKEDIIEPLNLSDVEVDESERCGILLRHYTRKLGDAFINLPAEKRGPAVLRTMRQVHDLMEERAANGFGQQDLTLTDQALKVFQCFAESVVDDLNESNALPVLLVRETQPATSDKNRRKERAFLLRQFS